MIGMKLPKMWSWDVSGGGRSACGITGERLVAQAELLAAIEDMPPGATGMVRRAHLSGAGFLLEYDEPVTRAWRDVETGVLVVELTPVPVGVGG